MYDGKAKTKALTKLFGDTKMSDLKVPVSLLTVKLSEGGIPVAFTSRDSNADGVLVREVVDASSAAPIYFPHVMINGEYYSDGGITNNDPIFLAIEFAGLLFGDEPIAILSLGTGISSIVEINPEKPDEFGSLRWISEGIFDIITQSRLNYNTPIIHKLIGKEHYLRITSQVVGGTDDISQNQTDTLIESAANVWHENEAVILQWLQDHSELVKNKMSGDK
jgi:predicted acylesterase/phospholipase RssA